MAPAGPLWAVCADVRACVCLYVRACVCLYVRVCVCVCLFFLSVYFFSKGAEPPLVARSSLHCWPEEESSRPVPACRSAIRRGFACGRWRVRIVRVCVCGPLSYPNSSTAIPPIPSSRLKSAMRGFCDCITTACVKKKSMWK